MLVYTLPETIMYVSGGHGPLDDHLPLQIRVDDILPGDPGSQALRGTAIYACRPRQTPSQPPRSAIWKAVLWLSHGVFGGGGFAPQLLPSQMRW